MTSTLGAGSGACCFTPEASVSCVPRTPYGCTATLLINETDVGAEHADGVENLAAAAASASELAVAGSISDDLRRLEKSRCIC